MATYSLDVGDTALPEVAGTAPRVRGLNHEAQFWARTIALGFALLAAEGLATFAYLLKSPDGPHRFALIAIALGTAVTALPGLILSGWVARQPWRTEFVFVWSIASIVVLALCGHLDGGLESPLLDLAVLPLMFAGLVLRPRAVLWSASVTLAAIVVVGSTDPDLKIPQESLLMLLALVLGVATLAVGTATHRVRLESERNKLIEELRLRAATDDLTGCWNQRTFHKRLEEEVDRAMRYNEPLSLIVCDVDLFGQFNNTFGHDAGDAALAAVGVQLRSSARLSDIVARIGGDEFAVLLPKTGPREAEVAAERLRSKQNPGQGSTTTLSIGVASLDVTDPGPKRLFRDADASMYAAKARGRTTVVAAAHAAAS